MASGFLRISNENIRRKSLDSSTSAYNTYVISLITPIKVYLNSQGQPVKTENNFFDKLVYLDKGTYRASDGSTYADRTLDFPVALSCVHAGYNRFEGKPFVNMSGNTITPSIEFVFSGQSSPEPISGGFIVTYTTIEMTIKFQVSEG